jgi:hypothetical protein
MEFGGESPDFDKSPSARISHLSTLVLGLSTLPASHLPLYTYSIEDYINH